jgi:hypothetical protein
MQIHQDVDLPRCGPIFTILLLVIVIVFIVVGGSMLSLSISVGRTLGTTIISRSSSGITPRSDWFGIVQEDTYSIAFSHLEFDGILNPFLEELLT